MLFNFKDKYKAIFSMLFLFSRFFSSYISPLPLPYAMRYISIIYNESSYVVVRNKSYNSKRK